MHWSKETSSRRCLSPHWLSEAVKLISYRIIGAMVKAIIG